MKAHPHQSSARVSASSGVAPPHTEPIDALGQCLERIQSEVDEVDPKTFIPITVDIPSVFRLVMGCSENIVKYKEEVKHELPRFPMKYLTKLDTYAKAMMYAHNQWILATAPTESIPDLVDELTPMRGRFVLDIQSLASRNHIDGSKLDDLAGGNAFANLASDILLMTQLLRNSWSNIEGHTGVTLAEIDRGTNLGLRLSKAVGGKPYTPAEVSAVSDTRQRTFTLLANAYAQVRRALTYVRSQEGDVDIIAPSIYVTRGSGPTAQAATTTTATTTNAATNPAAPVTATGATSNPASSATATAAPVTNPLITPGPAPKPAPVPAKAAAATTAAGSATTTPGMPGDPPFNR